ncbi:unnamed protein product, partial [Brugia timori]|uniref:Condensin complex subunit 2 n=1 Tax=Brugia timori TaxID=42155 RepID=A0A0R3QGI6_9BILA
TCLQGASEVKSRISLADSHEFASNFHNFKKKYMVCYINGLKDEDEEESSDDDFSMPKSKSAPNLQNSVIDGSNLNASQLRQAISAIMSCYMGAKKSNSYEHVQIQLTGLNSW